MRSRRLAVDDGSWLYHVEFTLAQVSGGTLTADHGDVDYITLNMSGTGDDPDYSGAGNFAPQNLTIWAAGVVITDPLTVAQQVFMGLDAANVDMTVFPGSIGSYFSDGRLDPSKVDLIQVGAKYEILGQLPSTRFEVKFFSNSDFDSSGSFTIINGQPLAQGGISNRPAQALFTAGTDDPDDLVAGSQPQTLNGLGGDDTLRTGSIQTDLFGDGGNDTLFDPFGRSNLYGGAGADSIYAGPRDYIFAGDDNDTIYAVTQTTDDLIANGYSGIKGYFDGGTGTDKAVFDLSADPRNLVFTLEDNFDDDAIGPYITSGGTLALLSIETVEIYGGTGNDTLTGANEIDFIFGDDGADTLRGGGGNDTLDGGFGGLAPGAFDTLDGGQGDDTFILHNGTESIIEGSGGGIDTAQSFVTYVLPANVEKLTLLGTAAIDATGNNDANTLIGNDAANTLTGLGGADVLDGGKGVDTMIGGAGDDTYFVDTTTDKVTEKTGEGTDTVFSSATFNLGGTFIETLRLTGTANINAVGNGQDNTLVGNDGINTVIGLGGADRLNGGKGADTMVGGAGDDTYYVDDSADKVTELAGEGSDTIYSTATFALTGTAVEALRLTGTAAINATGNNEINTLVGNDGANILTGLGGADTLSGGIGADTMIGGQGDDIYYVDNVGDKAQELNGEGTDTVFSTVTFNLGGTFVETLRLSGSSAINALGNSQANTLVGNSAANVINGSGGADIMIGGLGDDTYYVDTATDRVVEKTNAGIDTIFSSASFSLAETYVETLRLTGTAAIDAIGNGQANTLVGNEAVNTLTGFGGADVLDGGLGADTLIGGLGDDVFYVENVADKAIENAGEGSDTVYSTVTFALTGTSIETLRLTGTGVVDATGNDDANTLTGNDSSNVLTSLGGADVLDGGKGADTMIGGLGDDTYFVDAATDRATEKNGEGNDTIFSSVTFGLGGTFVETLILTGTAATNAQGNSQANTLIGNSGANLLNGFGGSDTLDGGLGADTLTGGDGADVFRFSLVPASANIDRITDFTTAVDKIALVSAAFNEMATGALPAGAFYAGTAAHDADDRIIYDAATGQLWFDTDGSGDDAAVGFATLAPNTVLAAADFVVI